MSFKNAGLAIGVDVGGSNIKAVLANSDGKFLEKAQVPTDISSSEAPVMQILGLINKLEHKARSIDRLIGIGVGVPGVAAPDGTVWAPNLPDWIGYPLKTRLQKTLLDVPVAVESDRTTAVLGETWLGVAQGTKNAVFLIVGTGIGAGILLDGRVYRGHKGVAGAVGWLMVDQKERKEYRKVGCLEAEAAGPAIARKAVDRIRKGASTVILNLANGDVSAVTAEVVAQAAEQGDPEARAILQEVGTKLGIAIAAIVNILNPEVVVVGGGVGKAFPLLRESISKAIVTWAQPLAAHSVQVVPSMLGEGAGLLGAVRLIFEQVVQEPRKEGVGDHVS